MRVCEVELVVFESIFDVSAALPSAKCEFVCVCVCLDGSDSRDKPKLYRLQHSITEVGSDCTEDGAIQVTFNAIFF